MVARVSTSELFRQGVNSILEGQAQVGKTSLQISSGQRITKPSDDPSGAIQSLQLSTSLAINTQFQRNNDIARQKLEYEEVTLDSVVTSLQRVRELVVQGNNDSQTQETRGYIASEIRQQLDEIFSLANTRDSNGEYIFSGFRSDTQSFVRDAAGNVSYQGDDGQRSVQVSPVRQIAIGDTGSDVFNRIRSGNGSFVTQAATANTGTGSITVGQVLNPTTWQANLDTYTVAITEPTPGNFEYTVTDSSAAVVAGPAAYQSGADIQFQGISVNVEGQPAAGDTFTVTPSSDRSIFETYQAVITALESNSSNPATNAQMHTDLARGLAELENDLENLSKIRSRVGSRLNALDSQTEINSGADLQLRTVKSSIEDLDYASAISKFQQQLTGLEAAQKTYIQIQGLSLFNFIR
jgi:flagellar hook-associated protein 3 FlgL